MSNRYARILAAGGAAVLVAGLGVTTALAAATAKTWTVQPGGAVHAKSGRFTIKDTTTGSVITCFPLTGFPLTASGTFKSGSGLPGSMSARCPRPASVTALAPTAPYSPCRPVACPGT